MLNIKGNQIELTKVHLGYYLLTMNHLWLHVARVIYYARILPFYHLMGEICHYNHLLDGIG
jgi:hypothetical protein